MSLHVVAKVGEIPDCGSKVVTVKGRPIAIFYVNGKYHAMLNRCPHEGANLARGRVGGLVVSTTPGECDLIKPGGILQCPWHGWEFDIETGQSVCDPHGTKAKKYAVHCEPGSRIAEGPFRAEIFPTSTDGEYVVVEV